MCVRLGFTEFNDEDHRDKGSTYRTGTWSVVVWEIWEGGWRVVI